MARILPLDELNLLKGKYEAIGDKRIAEVFSLDDIVDDLLDLYMLAVANGVVSINEKFGTDYQPSGEQIERVVYKRIDGQTWQDRVTEWYYNGGTGYDVLRIAETESHRIGNETAHEAAKSVGATRKKWLTMLDDKVRDTHSFLEGVSVGIDDYFYSYKGGKTLYPGQWGIAEEDCGCRCECEYS